MANILLQLQNLDRLFAPLQFDGGFAVEHLPALLHIRKIARSLHQDPRRQQIGVPEHVFTWLHDAREGMRAKRSRFGECLKRSPLVPQGTRHHQQARDDKCGGKHIAPRETEPRNCRGKDKQRKRLGQSANEEVGSRVDGIEEGIPVRSMGVDSPANEAT